MLFNATEINISHPQCLALCLSSSSYKSIYHINIINIIFKFIYQLIFCRCFKHTLIWYYAMADQFTYFRVFFYKHYALSTKHNCPYNFTHDNLKIHLRNARHGQLRTDARRTISDRRDYFTTTERNWWLWLYEI